MTDHFSPLIQEVVCSKWTTFFYVVELIHLNQPNQINPGAVN
jgi:hypothetical protein